LNGISAGHIRTAEMFDRSKQHQALPATGRLCAVKPVGCPAISKSCRSAICTGGDPVLITFSSIFNSGSNDVPAVSIDTAAKLS
jgi:hypothetical protein